MSFITRKFMPRRTFLRGMGTTLALPLLEAMVPAATPLAKTAAKPVRRLGFVCQTDFGNILTQLDREDGV